LWQAKDNRTYLFGGNRTQTHATNPISEQATLNDLLLMMDLDLDIPTRDVMSTETDLLCYTY